MEKQSTVPAQLLLAQLASSCLVHLLLHVNSSSFPPFLLAHLQMFYSNSSLCVCPIIVMEDGMLLVHFIRSTLTRGTSLGANYTGIYSIGIHM